MSEGMLGLVPLSDVRGPVNHLYEQLAGAKGPEVLERLKKMLRWAMFTVTHGDGTTKEQLLAAYNYVGDVARTFVMSVLFRTVSAPEDVDLEFIDGTDFDHDPTSEEVLEELARRGLEESTEEDALCYGATCPEGKDKRSVVFLHKANLWRGPREHLRVLVFDWYGSGRRLDDGWFDDPWIRQRCRFAGRRPRK